MSMMMVGASKFWDPLWDYYVTAPSVAFCRVPELEYASRLNIDSEALDHCCGEGIFASLAWPGKTISAGCDIDAAQIARANLSKLYQRTDVCDVSQKTPYLDKSFDIIFNNSALEHIPNLAKALNEVSRLLRPGGKFAFNVLNHRYFEWWPLGDKEKIGYRSWQPFYHALSIGEWKGKLENARLKLISVDGYFGKNASQTLARLDYLFSAYYIRQRPSLKVLTTLMFQFVAKVFWRARLAKFEWKTGADAGAGYFIQALRMD